MTSSKDVQASGAAQHGADLRRRNVPSGPNGSLTPSKEEVDDKKSLKVWLMADFIPELLR